MKNMGRKSFAMGLGAVALAAMVPGGTAFGQSASGQGAGVSVEQSKKVDEIFAKWDRTDSPGCALSAMQGGKIIYKRAYGMANPSDPTSQRSHRLSCSAPR